MAVTTLGDWAVLSPDSFGYLGAARSIAETGGWPAQRQTLPPGLSLLFAPLMWTGDAPLLSIRVLLITGWAIGCVLTYVYYRHELGDRWAAAAALIVATSPAILTQSACVLSELVFLPIVMAALVVMQSLRQTAPIRASRVFLSGMLVAAAIMVRTMGVALVPVAIIILLTRRGKEWRRRWALVALFMIAPFVTQAAWSWRNSYYDGGYGYREILTHARRGEPTDTGPIALQFDRAMRYGPARLETIEEAVIPNRLGWRLLQPPLSSWARWLIGGGLLLICACRLIARRSEADAFVLLLFCILAIWPWNEGPRFVLPMLPVFAGSCLAVIVGLRRRSDVEPSEQQTARIRRALCGCAISVVLVVQLLEVNLIAKSSITRRSKEQERVATMREVAGWLSSNVPADQPIACVMPNESNAKTIAIGAAYFANRPVDSFMDVFDDETVDWPRFEPFDTLTVSSLAESVDRHSVLLPANDSAGRRILMIRSSRGDPTLSPN